jgi:hypothetical protein
VAPVVKGARKRDTDGSSLSARTTGIKKKVDCSVPVYVASTVEESGAIVRRQSQMFDGRSHTTDACSQRLRLDCVLHRYRIWRLVDVFPAPQCAAAAQGAGRTSM